MGRRKGVVKVVERRVMHTEGTLLLHGDLMTIDADDPAAFADMTTAQECFEYFTKI
jgi:hypothetical protein